MTTSVSSHSSAGLSLKPHLATQAAVNSVTFAASDSTFLGSVLGETWDTNHAASSGYIDCMMPASDVDLTVSLPTAGPVILNFDQSVYDPKQDPGAGPRWIFEVDGAPGANIVIIGPAVGSISTGELNPGTHRVRFVQIGNTSGSGRWAARDPQLSRVTGVTLPADSALQKTQRPTAWFLPITDSIGEGYHNINATTSRDGPGSYTNVYHAWPSVVARLMNLSLAGELISGIGVVHYGTGVPYGALNADDPSGATDPWDHIFSGVPRPFTTAPEFILLNVGTNEFGTDANIAGHGANTDVSSSDANFQANILKFIERVRARPQLARTPIYLSIAFGGFKRTPIQAAVAAYKAAYPEESNLHVFDLAFGSPALTTTAGIDEVELFNGLTKDRADDRDTIPSPQAPDRTHPYAIATQALGSVDAHSLIGKVMAERLNSLRQGGAAPQTGSLSAGDVRCTAQNTTVTVTAARVTGGSAPYVHQFEKSPDGGTTWRKLGDAIDTQASTIKPLQVTDPAYKKGDTYRLTVTDSAEPMATAHSQATAPVHPGLFPGATLPAKPSSTVSGTLIQSLDGEWLSAQDLEDVGLTQKWFDPALFPAAAARPAQVPGSGTETWSNSSLWTDAPTNILWYLKTFPLEMTPPANVRYYLRFSAVKQLSEIWFNGASLGAHRGGEDPFEFDVTSLLQSGRPNTVAVRLMMAMQGGIWQHVTLVAQPEVRILDAFARPDAKAGQIHLEVTIENNTKSPAEVNINAALGEFKPKKSLESQATTITAPPGQTVVKLDLPVEHPHVWDLNDPFLYTVAITSDWKAAGSNAARHDTYFFRTGFRDIRMVDGYFQLNGQRFMLKSLHGNYYDPVSLQGTPRDMTYLGRDFPQLKKAGFNMLRFITAAALPEQLDQADEFGFFIYSEHESSWLCQDPDKYGITLNQIVRRDRNHPSLILWGLMNETENQAVYQLGKDWLPALRAIDDTRPVVLSSGRWERDHKTASISNTGSSTWDVYLGGEDPQNPKPTGPLHELGAYKDGTGDAHVYPFYPLSWKFITDFAKLNQDNPHLFFLSECGIGSSFNPIEEKRELEKAHAPASCPSWSWVNAGVNGTQKAWDKYNLKATYPSMEDFYVDSALEAARQRELIFSIVRSHPKINGYSLTGLQDFFGAGEGVMNNFREFKPGHLEVLQAGWAPLRWCLLVNPTNVYADQSFHIKAALANEDALPGGDYPATLQISGPTGVAWKQAVVAHVQQKGPLAYTLFDEEIRVPNLKEGEYTLEASLDGKPNAASSQLPFIVTSRPNLPSIAGPVTVAGVGQNIRDLLTRQGAQLHDYAPHEEIDRETILVGADFKGNASDWRALYARAARGAHVIFLHGPMFHADKERNKWLALPQKGDQYPAPDWLYHKEVVAKIGHPLLAGLPTKLMSPGYYGSLLAETHHFQDMTLPADTPAVAIYSSLSGKYHFTDGVMIGAYPFHAGRFTINAFNILGSIGNPATDRLLLNLVVQAQVNASPLAPLPADFDAGMDQLGIRD